MYIYNSWILCLVAIELRVLNVNKEKIYYKIWKNNYYLFTTLSFIAASRHYFLITNLGKRNRQTAASTSQKVVLMDQKYAKQ